MRELLWKIAVAEEPHIIFFWLTQKLGLYSKNRLLHVYM